MSKPPFIQIMRLWKYFPDMSKISSAEDREFDPSKGQTNNCKIDICCFSADHKVLGQVGLEWEYEALFWQVITIKIWHIAFVYHRANPIFISWRRNLFVDCYNSYNANLALSYNHSPIYSLKYSNIQYSKNRSQTHDLQYHYQYKNI